VEVSSASHEIPGRNSANVAASFSFKKLFKWVDFHP